MKGELQLESALWPKPYDGKVKSVPSVLLVVEEKSVRSLRSIDPGFSGLVLGPANARPLKPRAPAVVTAAMTFHSRPFIWSLSCILITLSLVGR